AVSVNTVGNTIDAAVNGSTLTIGGKTEVGAESGTEIYSIAVAGGGAGEVAAGLSSSINTVINDVSAQVSNTTLGDGSGNAGSLAVTASDRLSDGSNGTEIWALAGN